MINLISQVYDKLNKEIVSILLKNFVNLHLEINEILNYFFTINQLLYHIDFYANNRGERKYEQNLIKKYYELMSNEFSYCIENYKTEPGDDIIGYMNKEDRRRKVYMDDSCIILFI
jgi:hypothetical protein